MPYGIEVALGGRTVKLCVPYKPAKKGEGKGDHPRNNRLVSKTVLSNLSIAGYAILLMSVHSYTKW